MVAPQPPCRVPKHLIYQTGSDLDFPRAWQYSARSARRRCKPVRRFISEGSAQAWLLERDKLRKELTELEAEPRQNRRNHNVIDGGFKTGN